MQLFNFSRIEPYKNARKVIVTLFVCVKRQKKEKDRIYLKVECLDCLLKVVLSNDCVLNCDNRITVVIFQ